MNRLSSEDHERVMALITYSPEDRARINAVTKVNLFGHLKDVNPLDYSTPEGISKQLDKFVLPEGLLYYVDKDLQMQKIAVTRRQSKGQS